MRGEAVEGLDAAELAVMVAVVSARPRRRKDPDLSGPWRSRAQIEAAGHDGAVIAALIAAGWLVSWTTKNDTGKPIGPYLLPTPWGAQQMGADLWDQWELIQVRETRERRWPKRINGKMSRTYQAKVKRPAEITRWQDADKVREWERDRPEIRLPTNPNLCPIPEWLWATLPDMRPSSDPVEEAIAREEAARNAKGQAIRVENGEPVKLFTGPDGRGGFHIVIDKRMGPSGKAG